MLKNILNRAERSIGLTIFFFFALTLLVRYFFPFLFWHLTNFPFQRSDPYIYVLKGLEIAHGDWSPIRTHAIGWPLLLAGLFRLVPHVSIFENLVSASLLASALSALSIFPLIYIIKHVDPSPRTHILTMAFFCFAFPLTIIEHSGAIAMSEPLFILLFLISIALLYAAQERPAMLLASTGVAGLAYWVRPNGVFILPVILISYWLWERKKGKRCLAYIAAAIAVFWAIATPFLLQRAVWFGSAFYYGENSKYFSDTYTDAWGSAVPAVPFGTYISTHTVTDYADKFALGGLVLLLTTIFLNTLPYLLMVTCNVAERGYANKKIYPLYIAFFVWIVGLVPVFHIYYNPRHIMPLIPLFIVLAAHEFNELITKKERRDALMCAGIATAAFFMIGIFSFFLFTSKDRNVQTRDGALWANWLSVRLKGKIAIGNGSDILTMQLPDARIGGRGMFDVIAPHTGLETAYPGKFDDIDSLRPWLKKNAVDYLVLDGVVKTSYAFAPDKYLSIYTGETFPPYLQQVYSNYETNSQWKVRVFSVDRKKL